LRRTDKAAGFSTEILFPSTCVVSLGPCIQNKHKHSYKSILQDITTL
jgi:hypothetical protein